MVNKNKLTLYQPVTYQIKVPGILDKHWSDWNESMTLLVESNENDQPITILTGVLDQAALQGISRHLYSLGLPLISIICLE
jgi:hypothetical protein